MYAKPSPQKKPTTQTQKAHHHQKTTNPPQTTKQQQKEKQNQTNHHLAFSAEQACAKISLADILSEQKSFSGWGAGKGEDIFEALAVLIQSMTTLEIYWCYFGFVLGWIYFFPSQKYSDCW